MWTEADCTTFKVRGHNYITDKGKINSQPGLFKLIGIDIFEVTEPTHNIASHPRNRVSQALQRNEDVWVFLVNIMVPGPPYLSFVVYFSGDKVNQLLSASIYVSFVPVDVVVVSWASNLHFECVSPRNCLRKIRLSVV